MNIVSKTKEGRQWERQYKSQIPKLWRLSAIIHNAKENFGLESCLKCKELKKIGEECPECKHE